MARFSSPRSGGTPSPRWVGGRPGLGWASVTSGPGVRGPPRCGCDSAGPPPLSARGDGGPRRAERQGCEPGYAAGLFSALRTGCDALRARPFVLAAGPKRWPRGLGWDRCGTRSVGKGSGYVPGQPEQRSSNRIGGNFPGIVHLRRCWDVS